MSLTCRRLFWILFAIALIILIIFAKRWFDKEIGVPTYHPTPHVISLDQGWSEEQKDWYYYSTQGSAFPMHYSWFLALEQPTLTFGWSAPLFKERDYLGRFGLIFDDNNNTYNKDNLPIGFARDDNYVNPVTQEKYSVLGLTCAACHTGQLNYKGKAVRIDGGASMTNFTKFQNALGLAMMFTYYEPTRFQRFANRVLGENYSPEARKKLRDDFFAQLEAAKIQAKLDIKFPVATEEGFGRLDALNRIGNYVFAVEMNPNNYHVIDAPVTFPYLWGTSWLDWVQYNGSVMQPMTRNAGEALGVFATINLSDPTQQLFQSSIDVKNLYQFEKQLGGEKPFEGLKAPVWDEKIFGEIDQAKAERGKKLYAEKCQTCHLPPQDSDEICDAKYWTAPNHWGVQMLKVKMVNLELIGTDAQAATDWAKRFVDTSHLGLGLVKGEFGLPLTVQGAVELKYDELGFDAATREEYNGKRDNKVRSPLCYKARSLDGVWATPPFLHNGSVPNLYQLLSPAAERDKTFYLTSREFDPKAVGYKTDYVANGFKFDTTQIGNRNTGHEFRYLTVEEQKGWNGKYPYQGVLGLLLAEHERWEIIEYLKTLKPRDLNQQTGMCPRAPQAPVQTEYKEQEYGLHGDDPCEQ